jgi:hydrogenase maturation protein HypF
MLPYSPLHHLLMRHLADPIVLTSGNLTDEPQCVANSDARQRLNSLADAFCLHDRDIVNRLDDSVVRNSLSGAIMLRRARGYAPAPLVLHPEFAASPPVLATGADLKSAIALLRGRTAVVSQHLGDLATPLARLDFDRAVELYLDLYKLRPGVVACDLHPDFHTTRTAEALAERFGCPLAGVQHHHAHVAACLAENGVAPHAAPVLGIVLDGTGLGSDGTVWGGEFLIADYKSFERVAHFAAVPLLGGDIAARQPWRNAYAHLSMSLGWDRVVAQYGDVAAIARLASRPLSIMDGLMKSRLASPLCSSAGRLFDAVAALLGLCFERQDYEGEAAILLEGLAATHPGGGSAYAVEANHGILAWGQMFSGILDDLSHGRDRALIARKFHDTLVSCLIAEAAKICASKSIRRVALTGGCFNNAVLLDGAMQGLRRIGLEVFVHKVLPPGDGSLALGQSAIAAVRISPTLYSI